MPLPVIQPAPSYERNFSHEVARSDQHRQARPGCLTGWAGVSFGGAIAAVADLLTRGWVRLAGHLDGAECAALAKPRTLPWAEMAPKVGAVTQHGWFARLPFHEALHRFRPSVR